MFFAAGAASSALSAILSPLLQQQQSGQASDPTKTGFTASCFSVGAQSTAQSQSTSQGTKSNGGISAETMSALLAAQSNSNSTSATGVQPKDPMADLFSLLDGDGNGQISKSEFEEALGAGGTNLRNADDVFAKLDTDGDGSVSSSELASALKGKGRHHGPKAPGADGLAEALQGATASTKTNADGTTTTTLTYADGTKITSTSAAASSGPLGNSASAHALAKLIQQQAQMMASQTAASASAVSVSA